MAYNISVPKDEDDRVLEIELQHTKVVPMEEL